VALCLEGKSIFDCIMTEDFEFLVSFYGSQAQLAKWKEGLANLVECRNIKTAEFAKQSYFPVSTHDSVYHIVVPLFSSSMAEAIYRRLSEINFGAEQAKFRNQSRIDKYAKGVKISFSNIAVAKYGGAQPQNISMLNKGRKWKANKEDKTTYGIGYLFNSAPPIWKSQLKAPVQNKLLFDESSIYQQSRTDIEYLSEFLLRFERIELSIKHPERKKWVENWVGNIIDEVFYYISCIHQIPAGWSSQVDVKIKIEHQYLLDPYRSGDSFQLACQATDWQSVICSDFAKWLNRRLIGKDKQFTPQEMHTRLWYQLFENALREFNNTIDSDRKDFMEVVA
jgi:CRISPR-associated protein Csy1